MTGIRCRLFTVQSVIKLSYALGWGYPETVPRRACIGSPPTSGFGVEAVTRQGCSVLIAKPSVQQVNAIRDAAR